jgi:hypothetical protein
MSEPGGNVIKGYEILLGIASGSANVQVMKWDGTVGQTSPNYFQEITTFSNAIFPQNGDKFRARIVGSQINAWLVRGGVPTLIAQANNSVHTTGKPGMSFFVRGGGTPSSYCFEDYKVTVL